MKEFAFRPDVLTESYSAPSGESDGFNALLTSAAAATLRENNPVGMATGRYDEVLTIDAISEFFLTDLGYGMEDFVEKTKSSLMALILNSPLFPFAPDVFEKLDGSGCFYMMAANGVPKAMYVVKHDVVHDGRRQWVMSIRSDVQSQNLALLNRLFDNAYWCVNYSESGRITQVQWNQKLKDLTQRREAEFGNRITAFRSIVHPADLARFSTFFRRRIPNSKAGELDSALLESRLKVGEEWQWFRTNVFLVRRFDGSVCQASGIVCNINEEKLADEREVRHEAFLKAFSDGNLCEFFVDLKKDEFERFKLDTSMEELAYGVMSWDGFVERLSEKLVHSESRAGFRELLDRRYIYDNLPLNAAGLMGDLELNLGGRSVWARCLVLQGDSDKDGLPQHALVYLRDITLAKQREVERNELTREKEALGQLVDGVTRMVNRFAVCNLDSGTYKYFSFEQDIRYLPQGTLGELLERMDEMLTALDDEKTARMSDLLKPEVIRRRMGVESSVYRFDYCMQDKSAFMVMSVVPLEWKSGMLTKVMLVSEDSSQKHALEVMANTDALTGLFNARNLTTTLKDLQGWPFTLFYLDLDGFKAVNDTCGHDVGDQLLKEVASRLKTCVRNGDRVFRVGGDEFCIVAEGTLSEEACLMIDSRIKAAVAEPCLIGERRLLVRTSCGYASCPSESDSPEEIRILADHRMYENKILNHHQESEEGFLPGLSK